MSKIAETTTAFSHPSSSKQARTIITGASPVSDSILPTLNTLTDTKKPLLTVDNINQRVRSAEYAVRGELAVLSEQLRLDLKDPAKAKELPFDEVISANIGNPQQLDQKPITFFRQVLSLLECPTLLEFEGDAKKKAAVEQLYAPDAIERAKTLLKAVGSVGAYSQSQGALEIRKNVAKFIEGMRETLSLPFFINS
jgi:alanine transaminase